MTNSEVLREWVVWGDFDDSNEDSMHLILVIFSLHFSEEDSDEALAVEKEQILEKI